MLQIKKGMFYLLNGLKVFCYCYDNFYNNYKSQ
mgnify:CR=1 FL=1